MTGSLDRTVDDNGASVGVVGGVLTCFGVRALRGADFRVAFFDGFDFMSRFFAVRVFLLGLRRFAIRSTSFLNMTEGVYRRTAPSARL